MSPAEYNPNLEYFIGIGLSNKESRFFNELKRRFSHLHKLSSPPHITLKPPFVYHFREPLVVQLKKWASLQEPFVVDLKKVGSFHQKSYGTVFLQPDRTEPIKKLEQSLSEAIRFLPAQFNFTPHLTIGQRVPHEEIEATKQQLRDLNLELRLKLDRISLFSRTKPEAWELDQTFKFRQPVSSNTYA